MVFVDRQGADAFHRLTLARAQEEAVAHHVALHAQVIGQAHVARTADLLQHHVQHEGRALAQRGRCGTRPVGIGGLQGAHDIAHGRQRKISINIGSSACVVSAGSYKF